MRHWRADWGFHAHAFRYAVALWLATVLALGLSFFLQLEPAQWSAITVWIIFIQNPRLNYSKLVWWSFGTFTGAAVAVLLTAVWCQAPEVLVGCLSLWLALCAGAAPLLTGYRAYGAVLAGYTAAIVALSAVDHPDQIVQIAFARVSCIVTGMASAVVVITLLLARPGHWPGTRRQLGRHLRATLRQAADALNPRTVQPGRFGWRHMVARWSTLEHTLQTATAESADARIHAPPARSLVAASFDLLAAAQSVRTHLARSTAAPLSGGVRQICHRAADLLVRLGGQLPGSAGNARPGDWLADIRELQSAGDNLRQGLRGPATADMLSSRFVLDRLEEMLDAAAGAIQDWTGLSGPWMARRDARLAAHRDYRSAGLYAWRMFVAVNLAGLWWLVTQWPSGATFVLFIAVVCSLLSLVDHAPRLGLAFVSSALFCALMAGLETFLLLPRGEGFLVPAVMSGLFLLPAAYAYRHPRLIGGAVVSMLVFYGMTMPANQMAYDVTAFFNQGLALLAAVAAGFFAFHAVPSLDAAARRHGLLLAARRELAHPGGGASPRSRQAWTSRMFDRLRLLHRAAGNQAAADGWRQAESELLTSLQLGLRQHSLGARLQQGGLTQLAAATVANALAGLREIGRHPGMVALLLRTACLRIQEVTGDDPADAGALAELWEMTLLLETITRRPPGLPGTADV